MNNQKNNMVNNMPEGSMVKRFAENPFILTSAVRPSIEGMIVECVLNPGVFSFQNKTWLLLRVAERPKQKEGFVSLPILNKEDNIEILTFSLSDPDLDLSDARMVKYKDKMYLSTMSHLRLVCSDDGINFHEPQNFKTEIFGKGEL